MCICFGVYPCYQSKYKVSYVKQTVLINTVKLLAPFNMPAFMTAFDTTNTQMNVGYRETFTATGHLYI